MRDIRGRQTFCKTGTDSPLYVCLGANGELLRNIKKQEPSNQKQAEVGSSGASKDGEPSTGYIMRKPDQTLLALLYIPRLSIQHFLPPIVVEIQQVVNEVFIQRGVGYRLNIAKTYSQLSILLVFCVQSVQPTRLRKDFLLSDNRPFVHYMQFEHWAQKCLLIAKHTHFIDESDASLDPLMAISLSFTEQEATLAPHKNADDQTTKRLYAIAMEVLNRHISLQQNFQDTVVASKM